MALSDIFNRYSSGLGFGSVEPTLRREAQKFGLSDEELGRATEALGNHMLRKYGGGYTNYSSINAIVNGTIQNALNARVDPNYYTSNNSAWDGSSPIAGALNYAASPEQVFKHWRDDVDFWTSQIPAGYAETGGATWGDEDKNALTRLAIDASSAGKDWNSFIRRFADVGTGDGSSAWWGPQAKIDYFAQQLGLDPSKYVDQARREQQQRIAGEFGTASQQTNAGMGLEMDEIAAMAGFLAGGAALGGAFGGAGAAADIIGSDFAAGVGGSLGGVAGDVAAAANTLGGTIAPGWTSAEGGAGYLGGAASDAGALAGAGGAPGWTSGQDLLGGADLNFQNMSAPATGGTSGGNAMDWTDFLPSGTDSGGSFLDYIPQDAGPLTDVGSNLNAGDLLQQFSDVAGQAGSAGSNLLNQIRNLPSSAVQSLTQGGQNSALSRILGGNASTSDWASLLGMLGTGALSAYSANQNANAMKEIADRSWNAGAPYRDKLSATYSNPGAYLDSPEVQAILNRSQNALARSLSARDGNPIGSGRALNEMNDYAAQTMLGQLGNYRQQLANFGGQSALSGTYPQLGSQAADASSNIYNSLANTVSRVTQPQTDWQNILRMYGGGNGLA